MQFLASLAAFAGLATVALAQDPSFILQVNFPLTAGLKNEYGDFYTPDVSFYNGSLYIGLLSTNLDSEPFEASYYNETGTIDFLSYHQSPTGHVGLYLWPEDNRPLGLTVPHGGYVAPQGASTNGFGWNSEGYLTYEGENNFVGCENPVKNSYQIYWVGDEGDVQDPNGITCVGPLYLNRSNITLSSGIEFGKL